MSKASPRTPWYTELTEIVFRLRECCFVINAHVVTDCTLSAAGVTPDSQKAGNLGLIDTSAGPVWLGHLFT